MHVRELANELTSRNERIDTTSPVPLPRKLLFVSVGQLLETEFKHGEETRPSRAKGIPQVCPSRWSPRRKAAKLRIIRFRRV